MMALTTSTHLGLCVFVAWIIISIINTSSINDNNDQFNYIENGKIRLGINMDRGGAIGYLSLANSTKNIINDHDMGREVQLSFYSGPSDYNPDNKCPGFMNSPWPWNPIGAGDIDGNTGHIISITNPTSISFEIITKPLQWACDNVPCQCLFKRIITLNGNRADITAYLLNNRSDHTFYNARDQELPAVYSIGTLYQLWAYNGSEPFTNDSNGLVRYSTAPNTPWTPGNFYASENWAALINDNKWGIGVVMFESKMFKGGFAGTPDQGGTNDGNTGYIAPLNIEILDWNIQYQYNFSLILGYLNDIRNEVYTMKSTLDFASVSAPNYVFNHDRNHFYYVNCVDTGINNIAKNGYLMLNTSGASNPYMIGPIDLWKASDVKTIKIKALYSTNHIDNNAKIYWSEYPDWEHKFNEQNTESFKVILDGNVHEYSINMTWKGTITSIRFDPIQNGAVNSFVHIYSITQ